MNKFIDALKSIGLLTAVASVLLFTAAFMLGRQTTTKEVKKHYIVDASEVEVIYNNPYKALTLDECVTDWECETAQLIADNRDGKLIRTDDPIFFPDAIQFIEPIECETGDKECQRANKLNAGKPASYPAVCEPYIFANEHK